MKIHLIGVGGISMRGLAQYYLSEGHTVSGCDLEPPKLAGITTIVGHDPSHITGVDLVVYTSAIAENSPGGRELAAARSAGLRIQKRAEAIGAITRERKTVTVSGMHGKSTTTGMVAHILTEVHRDPLVMVGAPLPAAGGATFRAGAGPFVLEADEFDRSFLQFSPDIAILTNIEPEHLDYFRGGLEEIIDVFVTFLHRLKPEGTIIACGDDQNIATALSALKKSRDTQSQFQVITYGRGEENDYQIAESRLGPEMNTLTIFPPDRQSSSIVCNLKIPGLHNQLNATAALAAADTLNIPREKTVAALASFRGVGGRFELLANRDGVVYISDYAHHPTEVTATLAAARAWYPNRRLVVIFQPHQYVRTKIFFSEFAAALAAADVVVVTDIFAVAGREEARDVTAQDLAEEIKRQAVNRAVSYLPFADLPSRMGGIVKTGDIVMFLGAGREIARLAESWRGKEFVS